jgi:hypothetical protein
MSETNKKTVLYILTAAVFFAAVFAGFVTGGSQIAAAADNPLSGTDGTYSVSLDLSGLTMGADNFDDTAKLEKSGGKYYLYFRQKNASAMKNLDLKIDGKQVGCLVTKDDGVEKIFCYTLGGDSVQSGLNFTAYVPQMGRSVDFTVRVDLAGAVRKSTVISDLGERPAEFVPVLSADAAGESEAAQNSVFLIKPATATLGGNSCSVTVGAYYITSDNTKQTVAVTPVESAQNGSSVITGYRITLENVGEYHYFYRAESALYKTSAGNNTFTQMDMKIISKAGGIDIAKFADENGAVPDGAAIQASKLTYGNLYDAAASAMKSVADNFEVFDVSIIGANGEEVQIEGYIKLFLKANSAYNRNDISVYRMTDGRISEVKSDNYGRYVAFDTDDTGTFIVCVPGVAFIMPMWGYALITVACALVLAAAITVTVIFAKKKKKAKAVHTAAQND